MDDDFENALFQLGKLTRNWVQVKEFDVTKDHIRLLQGQMVSWIGDEEIGAPCIDIAQPYGSTCKLCDMAKILKMKPKMNLETGKTHYTEEQQKHLDRLHKETQIALQIFLKTGKMEEGNYVHDGWYNWRKK